MMKFNKTKTAAVMLAFMAATGAATAATDGANLAVSATVQTACAINDGTLAFGNIAPSISGDASVSTPANVDLDSGATVQIACTNGATGVVTAGNGLNYDVASKRQMRLGESDDLLAYELYTDSSRGTVLNGTNGISYTGTGATQSVTVYGRILGTDLQTAKVGSYADTVALTVTYTP